MGKASPRRIGRVLLLLGAIALATGCATRLAYYSADFLIERYVDDFVQFDDAQQADFDARLEQLLQWHRTTELPAYAGWLASISGAVGSGRPVDGAQVEAWTEELGAFWQRIGGRLAPELVAFAPQLDDAQVGALVARLREEHEERVARFAGMTPEERLERRARSMERFLRRWTGRLTDAQGADIAGWAEGLRPTTEQWLASRAGWIEELSWALGSRSDPRALAAAADRLIVDPSARWSDAYRAAIEANTAHTSRFLAAFLNGLNEEQRARAARRLAALAGDLLALADDP